MPFGPIQPISMIGDTSGDVTPGVVVGATNSRLWEGMMIAASIAADRKLSLIFPLPLADPGDTLKLVLTTLADVTAAQNAIIRVNWAGLSPTENFDTVTLANEHSGGDLTIAHATTEDEEPKETKVTLDGDTITYGTDKFIVMEIDLESTGWTLAVPLLIVPALIWEA